MITVATQLQLSLCVFYFIFFFFKQKTAYEMRISDWSSDVCSSDLTSARLIKSPPKPLNSVSRKYRNSGTLFTRVQGQHGPVAMTPSCLAVNSPLHLSFARAATCHRPVAAHRCRWIDHSAPAPSHGAAVIDRLILNIAPFLNHVTTPKNYHPHNV